MGPVRNFLNFTFVSCLCFFISTPAFAASTGKKDTLEDLSRDAYIWGYPAVLLHETREAMLGKMKNPQQSINHFFHSEKAPNVFFREIIPANTENLYSWAWVDLNKEPLVFTHPVIVDRYYAVHFIDAYSNVFRVVSNSNNSENASLFLLTGPDWKGALPEGAIQIKASTPEVFVFAQTFLRNEKELPQLQKIVAKQQLIPLSDWNKGIQTESFKDGVPVSAFRLKKNLAVIGIEFFEELRQVMARNPAPTSADARELKRFIPLGIQDSSQFAKNTTDAEAYKMIERGLFEGERQIESRIATGFGPKVNGWSYEMKIPPFSDDYLLRAAVAKKSFFSPYPEESVQMTVDMDSEARQLFSSYRYVIHFDSEDLPPAHALWSLRVYDSLTKNLASNPRRHPSLNDRSSNLKFNSDGSVDILVQSEYPGKSEESNWLALSRNANFYITLTAYNPGNTIINRKYIAPSLTRVDENGIPKQKVVHTMMAQQAVSK